MRLAEIRIENFRNFGEKDEALTLALPPGIAVLVGENDGGKTAIVDAIRLVLGTRGQEYFRVVDSDFHQPAGVLEARREIRIMLRFDTLSKEDRGAFVEHLTYRTSEAELFVHWRASAGSRGAGRRFLVVESRSGECGDGPTIDAPTRALLCTTYLRPLRDADQALSAGRGSRLAQILQQTSEIASHGDPFDPALPPGDPSSLSVLGIGDFTNDLLERQTGIVRARNRLNDEYLAKLSFAGDLLKGVISVGGAKGDDATRLRQLLEKLELDLRDDGHAEPPPSRGLGSNNLLFMASELLLLAQDEEGYPSLLIEEPEAHLHPQRQIRLIEFLKEKAAVERTGQRGLQVLMTTHSPTLAASLPLESLVLIRNGKAFPMGKLHTCLESSDYAFLERFLDATKANFFFARGVLIVEGDGEAILLPTLSKLIGRDLAEHGVSLINVGGTGLGRYARVFQRRAPSENGKLDIPVACVADMDVMPDCAPGLLGLLMPDGSLPARKNWKCEKEFTPATLMARRERIAARADGQSVKTFVSDAWTLEYDLALRGLAREVWLAANLAVSDAQLHRGTRSRYQVMREALRELPVIIALPPDERATIIYSKFHDGASKAIAAQYLAGILSHAIARRQFDAASLRAALPAYLVDAIDYATGTARA